MPQRAWKWVIGGTAAVIVVLLLAHRFLQTGFDWRLAAEGVRHLGWGWVALSLVPIAGTYWVRALRWAVFLKPLKEHPSLWNLTSATIVGFSAIVLFGRPGEFVRPYLIAVKEHVPLPSQLAAWLLERIFDLLMVVLIFGYALTRLSSTNVHVGPELAWVLMAGGRIVALLGGVIVILLLSMRHFGESARRSLTAALRFLPVKKFARLDHLIATFVQGIESTRSDGALLLVFVYSVLEWAVIVVCYWCLFRSYGDVMPQTFPDLMIFVGFVSFGAVVQIPGVGGGVQVATVIILTQLFRVKLELATSFAFVSWILTFVAITPLGLVLALKEGLDWGSLRRLGREVE